MGKKWKRKWKRTWTIGCIGMYKLQSKLLVFPLITSIVVSYTESPVRSVDYSSHKPKPKKNAYEIAAGGSAGTN